MNTHTTADVSTQTEFHDYEHEDEDDIFHDALEVRVPPIRREEESATEPQHPLEAANIDVIILNAVLDSCLEEIAALREELTDVYKQRAEAHAEFARIEAVLFEVLGIDHAAECVVCVWD
ncbi:hypothetical protein PMZ80_007584 [Knufia obscura]|uniref:Uncharacterized protein n=2 Tax=Knufia TaxID=430999 RepID=A0AAN8INF9_9EURO|nr:hypothetical protein PMZ80_007584 [Knufia obscura]KAK5954127.1 hypothetical protein OHC33_004699 [Knufia fluminis]